tara:strand:- start:4720 stop:7716 length:2997 start_codon:yes stop_codon:yes gene_type:complete
LVVFAAAPSNAVEFNRDIRPLLSDRCFQCHGPDEETVEAGLRLDSFEHATADLGGHAAIVPGDPEQSELLFRISEHAEDDIMPPLKSKKQPLTKSEIDLMRRWIKEGAQYQGHWSFEPIASVDPPSAGKNWAANPIDRFIARKLGEHTIKPAPPADPHTLAKRIAIDVIGLLPTPQQTKEFVAAYSKNRERALEAYADQLLASPHHGERWGRHWLDQARYADSNGYTIDGDRVMWPYRDWVIRAINDDLPFDQFTIEQLAGDLLNSPTKAQRVATGFHRNTLINQEGGTDNEQFRNEAVVDRVNTTGAVWLGLTLGCAQCHTHKFDPITHRDYFKMFAFFNHGVDVNNTGPTVEVGEGELFLGEIDPLLTQQVEKAKTTLAKLAKTRDQRQAAWEKSLKPEKGDAPTHWTRRLPSTVKAAGGAPLQVMADASVLAGKGAANEAYHVDLEPSPEAVAAVRLQVLTEPRLPKNGPGLAGNGNFVLTEVELWNGDERVPVARVQADHSQPGYDAAGVIDQNPNTGWAINVGRGSSPGAKMNANHEVHLILAHPLPPGTALRTVLRHEKNPHYNVGRFAIDVSSTIPAPTHHEQLLAALQIPKKERTDSQKKLLSTQFDREDQARKETEQELAALRQKMGLGKENARAMVMADLKKPRETYIHIRGDFLRKDQETGLLHPDVPEVLPPLTTDAELPTRLDLARWLVSDANPLTARVTVNRVWMRYFGLGLVETENDFGTQGTFPTHPELLDWLANWFRTDAGWSMKKLHKLIVTSATYQQSSHHRPELMEIDARNLLLARQNRLRFDAEIIRDAALGASGLLFPQIGGPSVRPPQPTGVYAFTQTSKNWVDDRGSNRYRRALYTKFYRSAPYPMLSTFDVPDFQTVCTRRERSNTPLQALTVANSLALFEMAKGLSERLLREADSPEERITLGFELCYARQPSEREMDVISSFQISQRAQFALDLPSAKLVATEGATDVAESASWTAVARALINTDEFITRE